MPIWQGFMKGMKVLFFDVYKGFGTTGGLGM